MRLSTFEWIVVTALVAMPLFVGPNNAACNIAHAGPTPAAMPQIGDRYENACGDGTGDLIVTGFDDDGDIETKCKCHCGAISCYEPDGWGGCTLVEDGKGSGGDGDGDGDGRGGSTGIGGCKGNWESISNSLHCGHCGGVWELQNPMPCVGGQASGIGFGVTAIGLALWGARYGYDKGLFGSLAGALGGFTTGIVLGLMTCDYHCRSGSRI